MPSLDNLATWQGSGWWSSSLYSRR